MHVVSVAVAHVGRGLLRDASSWVTGQLVNVSLLLLLLLQRLLVGEVVVVETLTQLVREVHAEK